MVEIHDGEWVAGGEDEAHAVELAATHRVERFIETGPRRGIAYRRRVVRARIDRNLRPLCPAADVFPTHPLPALQQWCHEGAHRIGVDGKWFRSYRPSRLGHLGNQFRWPAKARSWLGSAIMGSIGTPIFSV